MNAAVAVQLILTVGALATAVLGYFVGRRNRHVTAEVTLSVEARAWAQQFEDRARNAETRAERAEARADQAEDAAAEAARRTARAVTQVENCQARVDVMERHIQQLRTLMREHGLEPPPMPPLPVER